MGRNEKRNLWIKGDFSESDYLDFVHEPKSDFKCGRPRG